MLKEFSCLIKILAVTSPQSWKALPVRFDTAVCLGSGQFLTTGGGGGLGGGGAGGLGAGAWVKNILTHLGAGGKKKSSPPLGGGGKKKSPVLSEKARTLL